MHRWLFEVEGGHVRTQWTRRRIEDTRPSIVDPVSVLDAAHGRTGLTGSLRKIDRRQRYAAILAGWTTVPDSANQYRA